MFNKPVTLGIIVGNRGFFPGHLCEGGRVTILKVLEEEGIQAVAISPEETPYGSVESLADARKLADLSRVQRSNSTILKLSAMSEKSALPPLAGSLRLSESGKQRTPSAWA